MCFRRKVCRVGRVQVRSRPLEIIPAVRRSRLYLSTRESAGCRQVEERGNCRIGSLEFDRNGITSSGVIGTRKRANWSQLPEVRSTSKAPLYSYTSTSGIIEICYHYPPTGQIVVIGRSNSAEENGCLVPLLIE